MLHKLPVLQYRLQSKSIIIAVLKRMAITTADITDCSGGWGEESRVLLVVSGYIIDIVHMKKVLITWTLD